MFFPSLWVLFKRQTSKLWAKNLQLQVYQLFGPWFEWVTAEDGDGSPGAGSCPAQPSQSPAELPVSGAQGSFCDFSHILSVQQTDSNLLKVLVLHSEGNSWDLAGRDVRLQGEKHA